MTYRVGWIDTARPLYCIRREGGGENIVRNGDIVEDILSGALVPPDGPLWLSESKLSQLTKADIKALKKAGVTKVLPIDTVAIR